MWRRSWLSLPFRRDVETLSSFRSDLAGPVGPYDSAVTPPTPPVWDRVIVGVVRPAVIPAIGLTDVRSAVAVRVAYHHEGGCACIQTIGGGPVARVRGSIVTVVPPTRRLMRRVRVRPTDVLPDARGVRWERDGSWLGTDPPRGMVRPPGPPVFQNRDGGCDPSRDAPYRCRGRAGRFPRCQTPCGVPVSDTVWANIILPDDVAEYSFPEGLVRSGAVDAIRIEAAVGDVVSGRRRWAPKGRT